MKLVPKGVLKALIIKELSKSPKHGYELMNAIAKDTNFWRPSPGTIYPTLKSMVSAGIVTYKRLGRRKVYFLSKKGRRLMRKLEKTRKTLKKEIIKTLSSTIGIDEKTFEKDFLLDLKSVPVGLKKMIAQLSFLTLVAFKKGKEKKAKELLERCLKELVKL